jgi:uncharacterized protein YgiM (DUF1202 family)
MNSKTLLKMALVPALAIAMLPAASPAHAASATVGQFYAGCGNFSVGVDVKGTTDDGGGNDRIRYLVIDANNKLLYQEDASRRVNTADTNVVVNLVYQIRGNAIQTPDKNPVKFVVQDLDSNNNAIAELSSATYNAQCIPAASSVTRRTPLRPKVISGVNVKVSTAIYPAPGAAPMNLTVGAGTSWQVVYRSPDSQWVAIWVSSPELVWIPVSTVEVNLSILPTPPVRIEGSGLGPVSNSGSVASGPTAVTLTYLRLRAAPSASAAVLTVIPYNTTITVIGRNANRTWIQASFGGKTGWVSASYLKTTNTNLADLPVVG